MSVAKAREVAAPGLAGVDSDLCARVVEEDALEALVVDLPQRARGSSPDEKHRGTKDLSPAEGP